MSRPPPPVDRRDHFDIKPTRKPDKNLEVTLRQQPPPGARWVPRYRTILAGAGRTKEPSR